MGLPGTVDNGDKPIDFLVGTGGIYSVLNTTLTKKSSDASTVTGVTGQLQQQAFLQPLEYQLGDQKLMRSSLHDRLPHSIAEPRITL